MLVIGEDEDPPEVSSRAAKQIVRRQAAVTQMVEDALVNRVENAHGPNVMHVDWEQYMKMREDSEFQSFAKYSFHLLNYTDGRPRPQPVRPFLKNEVGIYREKIVCLKSMPGDSKGDTPYVQVPVQLEAKPAFTVEDDPFPSPKLSVEPGGKS